MPKASRNKGGTAAVTNGADNARAANTMASYRSAWAAWQAWAGENGAGALPASPAAVVAYLAHRAAAGAKLSTLRMAKAAIAAAHKENRGRKSLCLAAGDEGRQGSGARGSRRGKCDAKAGRCPYRRSACGDPRHGHRAAYGTRRAPGNSRQRHAPGIGGYRPLRRDGGRRLAAFGGSGIGVGRPRAYRRWQRQGDDPPVEDRWRRGGRRGGHYRARHGGP